MRSYLAAAILFSLLAMPAAAADVSLSIGENSTHTVTVYNPLNTADTITVTTVLGGDNRDTFAATRDGAPLTDNPIELRVPPETNQSISVSLAAQYCTAARCDATLTFTASSQATGLQDTLTVGLTTATADTGETDGSSTTVLSVLAVTLLAAVGVAAAIIYRILLTD